MRHRLTASYLCELPFGKGKAMLNHGGIANLVLGGWQTNGILTIQTGLPFSAVLQTSTTNGTGSRPNVIGPVVLSENPAALVRPVRFRHAGAVHLRQRGRAIRLFGPGRTTGTCRCSRTS